MSHGAGIDKGRGPALLDANARAPARGMRFDLPMAPDWAARWSTVANGSTLTDLGLPTVCALDQSCALATMAACWPALRWRRCMLAKAAINQISNLYHDRESQQALTSRLGKRAITKDLS